LNYTPFRAVALSAATAISLSIISLVHVRADVTASTPEITSANTESQRQPAVKSNDSDGGVIPSSTFSVAPTAAVAGGSRHGTRGEYLARTALSYRGLRYRFGGESVRGGFDCSGLVREVCAKWGIYLPRAANAQFGAGKPVSRAALEPGDLVFFKNTYKRGLSHVGIYIGHNLFLHAAGRRQGVLVSSLFSAYHLNHWAGARRLDLSKLPAASGSEKVSGPVTIDMTDDDSWLKDVD